MRGTREVGSSERMDARTEKEERREQVVKEKMSRWKLTQEIERVASF